MNAKKWIFLCIFVGLVGTAFLKRDVLRVVYIKGNEVAFPNMPVAKKNSVSIFVVGSEGTLKANLVENISKTCPNISISTKVNRHTNFAWQEKNELHRFIREGAYGVVLIETAPVDFLTKNKDRVARFESSARKSNSKLFYWSATRPKTYPDNFLIGLPKDLETLCLASSRLSP